MKAIGDSLPDNVPFNHAIVVKYSDGVENHAPPHRDFSEDKDDKTGCIKKGAGFSVISVGEPRLFQFLASETGPVVWEMKLPHRSTLYVPAEFNVAYWRTVPKDKHHTGVRRSLIFRDILAPVNHPVDEEAETKTEHLHKD